MPTPIQPGGGDAPLTEHGVSDRVKPRGAANPTPPTGAAIKQQFYENPAAADAWHQQKAQIVKLWPNMDPARQAEITNRIMDTKFADYMGFTSEWIDTIMRRSSVAAAEHWPISIAQTATVQKDPRITGLITDADQPLQELYGNDQVGPVLSTFLISHSISGEKTRNLFEMLTGITPVRGADMVMTDPRLPPGQTPKSMQDILEAIVAAPDPEAVFRSQDSTTQFALQKMMNDALGSATALGNSLSLAHTILNNQDFTMTLSESDLNVINSLVKFGKHNVGGGTTSDLNEYTAALRARFVRNHPDAQNADEATLNRMIGIDQFRAIGNGQLVVDKEWSQQHPDKYAALKVYMEQTFPAIAIVVGRQGVVPSFIEHYGRGIETIAAPFAAGGRQVSELIEKLNFGPFTNDTAAMTAARDELKRKLDNGEVPKSQQEQALKDLHNWNEDLSSDIGWDGFTKDIATSVRSESPGMGFGHLYAEGIGINPGDVGYTPVVAVSGLLSQIVFDPVNWVTAGVAGILDARFIPKIPGVAEDLESIAKGIRAVHADWSEAEVAAAATASHEETLARIATASESGTVAGGDIYQEVGGWLHQRVYQAFAKYPEELAVSRPFMRAQSTIWKMKQALSDDHFIELMTNRLGNRDLAIRLAGATSEADMQVVLTSAMTGGLYKGKELAPLLLERRAISKQLRDLKYAEDGRPWEVVVDDLYTQYDAVYASRRASRSAELEDINRQLDHAEAKYEDYLSKHQDLRARRAWATDVIRGNQTDAPVHVLTGRQVRQLRRMTDRVSAFEDPFLVSVDAEAFDAAGGATADATVKQPYLFGERAHQLWRTYSHPFTNFGYGHDVALEGTGVAKSIQELHKFGLNLGLSDGRMADLLAPLANRSLDGDIQAQFDFIHSTWKQMVEESDLPAAAKLKIADIYKSKAGPRMGGLTNEAGQLWPTPTLYDAAKYGHHGVPLAITPDNVSLIPAELGYRYKSVSIDELPDIVDSGQINGKSIESASREFASNPEAAHNASTYGGSQGREVIIRIRNDKINKLTKTYTPGEARDLQVLAHDGTWQSAVDLSGESDLATGLASGWPSISAREIKTVAFKLPSLDQMFEFRGFTRNIIKDYEALGGAKKWLIAKPLHGAGMVWEGATNLWKDAVLIPRLFGAIPARIFMEEQLRMAAYGEASAVWHPLDWFQSLESLAGRDRSVLHPIGEAVPGLLQGQAHSALDFVTSRSADELRLVAEDPTALLGGITDGFINHGRMVPRGGALKFGDKGFNEGVNILLKEWLDSPELMRWHLANLGDTEATIEAMRLPENQWLSEKFFARYKRLGMSDEEAVTRTQRELLDHIGKGEGADLIRDALANDGKVINPYTGQTVKIGNDGFTKMLDKLAEDGKWQTNTKMISGDAFAYIPPDRLQSLYDMRDWIYKMGYSAPEAYAARSPLFRNIAYREYRNLIASGYSTEDALRLGYKIGAERTADMMFTIGAHTTGEHFIRNLSPFFPAWRELADTWLVRIPTHLGKIGNFEGAANTLRLAGWGIGSVELAHRATLAYNALKESGLLTHDANGNLVMPIPFLNPLIRGILGVDVPQITNWNIDSSFSLLPMPINIFNGDQSLSITARAFGAAPTLGAIPTLVLGSIEDLLGHPHWTQYLNDVVAPYGMDPSLSTTNVANIMMGLGLGDKIFWENGPAKTYREQMQLSSVSDGLRMYTINHPMPDLPKEAIRWSTDQKDEWTQTVLKPYTEAAISYAQNYSRHSYLAKGILGGVMPLSLTWTAEAAQHMQQLWDMIAPFKGLSGKATSNTIATFLQENPELEAYMTGKYSDTRTSVNADEGYAGFHDALGNGDVTANIPDNQVALMNYANQRNVLHRRKEAVDKQIESGPRAQWAMNYLLDPTLRHKRTMVSTEIKDWEVYFRTGDSQIGDQTAPAGTLYDRSQAFIRQRNGEPDTSQSLSWKQEKVMQAEDAISALNGLIVLDPAAPETAKYYKATNRIHDQMAAAYKATGDPIWKAIGHFFDTNSDYYDKLKGYYKQLTGDPINDSIVYNQIRQISSQAQGTSFHGFDLPSAEQYSFENSTPEEQRAAIAKWAAEPGTWLTDFQREKAGYQLSPKQSDNANKVINYALRQNNYLYKYEQQYGQSDTNDAIIANAIKDKAKKLGVSKWWAATQQPAYVRLDNALNLTATVPQWDILSRWATDYRNQLTANSLTVSGGSDMAKEAYKYFLTDYHNIDSPELKQTIQMLSAALATTKDGGTLSEDDTVLRVFFDTRYHFNL